MTALKEEKPFAAIVHTEYLCITCSFCFAQKPMQKCKGCHILHYCNDVCQKNDSKNHKKECRLYKKAVARDQLPSDYVRFVTRILTRDSMDERAFNGRTWDSLEERSAEIKDEKLVKFNKAVDDIHAFVKPEVKRLTREKVAKTFGKILTNAIGITDSKDSYRQVGLGIYLGLSIHKHSCVSDAQLIFNGAKASLKRYDQAPTYSPDLTLSYSNCVPCFPNRKEEFKTERFFECTCELCSDKNHIVTRMGSSCYVTCCEDGAGILDANSNGPYRCNKCGDISPITVEDVKSAESLIDSHFELVWGFHDEEMLGNSKDIMEATEKILSVYNFQFIHLCGAVVVVETGKRNYETCKHAHEMNMKAFDYYLHDTDKRKTSFLMKRVRMLKEVFDEEDTSDVNQALRAAVRTFGGDHPVVVVFKRFIEWQKLRDTMRPLRGALVRRLEELGMEQREEEGESSQREQQNRHHHHHYHHHHHFCHHHNHRH